MWIPWLQEFPRDVWLWGQLQPVSRVFLDQLIMINQVWKFARLSAWSETSRDFKKQLPPLSVLDTAVVLMIDLLCQERIPSRKIRKKSMIFSGDSCASGIGVYGLWSRSWILLLPISILAIILATRFFNICTSAESLSLWVNLWWTGWQNLAFKSMCGVETHAAVLHLLDGRAAKRFNDDAIMKTDAENARVVL